MTTTLTSYNKKGEIVSKLDVTKLYPKGRKGEVQTQYYKLVYTTTK